LSTSIDRVDTLGLQNGAASSKVIAGVHGALKGIVFPAKHVISMLSNTDTDWIMWLGLDQKNK